MCDIAAEAILLQCWRRSGFIDHTVNKTATDLSLLPKKNATLKTIFKNCALYCVLYMSLPYLQNM